MAEENASVVPLPAWLKAELFEQLLAERYGVAYAGIKSFRPVAGLKPGENYSSIMLRLHFEVELQNQTIEKVSYMLKTPHDFEMFREILKKNNMFEAERDVFLHVIPELEQLYEEAGLKVQFGAKAHEIDAPDEYVLVEDLRPLGFKNADRLEGLDMSHTLSVLQKLAQWHAASATRIELKGAYIQNYLLPTYMDNMRNHIEQVAETLGKYLLKCLPLYGGHEEYSEAVHKIQPKIVELMYAMNKPNTQDFNVLNHGDCWTNNIMFRYASGSSVPAETYFVDLQLPKVASVAHDLLYYHEQLVEHLKVLKYPEEKIPSLRFLHMQLLKYGCVGYHTVLMLCPPVLLDPNDNANLSDFITEAEQGNDLKMKMYSNDRYRKHISAILPWLHNRGALELEQH